MPRPISKIAPDWWDYTTLDPELLADAAALSPEDLRQMSRPGFTHRDHRHARGVLHRRGVGIRRWRGNRRRRIAPRESAAPSGRPSSCRWWRRIVNAIGPEAARLPFLGHG